MEELRISREEYRLLTDGIAHRSPSSMASRPAAPTQAIIAQLSTATAFSRRVGVSYDDLLAILKTRFVNPNGDLIPKLEKLGMPFAALKEFHDGTMTDQAFDERLPQGAAAPDPAEYGGDIKAWVKDAGELRPDHVHHRPRRARRCRRRVQFRCVRAALCEARVESSRQPAGRRGLRPSPPIHPPVEEDRLDHRSGRRRCLRAVPQRPRASVGDRPRHRPEARCRIRGAAAAAGHRSRRDESPPARAETAICCRCWPAGRTSARMARARSIASSS